MKTIKVLFVLAYSLFLLGCSSTAQYARRATWKDEFKGKGSPNNVMWTRSESELNDTYLSVFCDNDSNAYILWTPK